MTSSSFSRSGAIDLSSLANRPTSGASPTGAPGAPGAPGAAGVRGGGRFRVEVTEQTLPELVQRSSQYPVIIEFTTARAPEAQQLSADLDALAEEAGGKWLLARADTDAHPQLAQMVGLQAVPAVVAALSGQLVPLFQGPQPREQIAAVVAQVLQAAVANGVVGTVEPQAGEETAEPVADPRLEEAETLMGQGDFAGSEAAFDAVLAAEPGHAGATAGRASARLWARAGSLDPQQAITEAEADPADVDAQLGAADGELLLGRPEAAFARLVGVVRRTAGDERDRVRVRLLELFETVGQQEPSVLSARRDLMSALF